MGDADDSSHHDLRAQLPPIRDQGDRGTCVAFAITAVHELHLANGGGFDLAEEVLYWGCKQIDGDFEDGTTYVSANDALQRWGQPEEYYWPYDKSHDVTSKQYRPPSNAIDPKHCYSIRLKEIDGSVGEIRRRLSDGVAVAIGIPIWNSIFVVPDGNIPLPLNSDLLLGGHAVTLVGFDDDHLGGSFFIRNSWGDKWGVQGYGFLPYVYVESYLITAWSV